MEAYDLLLQKQKEIALLGSSLGIVHWDLETYMPPRGIMQRSEQLALLNSLLHRMSTTKELGELIEKIEKKEEDLDDVQKRVLYLTRREYDIDTRMPEELVAAMAKQNAISVETWKKAKAANKWKQFEPELQKMVDLKRKEGEFRMEVLDIPVLYDAMLDRFERNMRSADVSKMFEELRKGLVPLAKKCAEASSEIDTAFLDRVVPVETQRRIAEDLCKVIGYDISSENAGGRIDEVEHPFTTGYYDDVRITVKYHEDNVSSAIYAILHEGGHALYEQNLNPEWKFNALGIAASYGIHESMSRFIENMIGRSPEFLEYYKPRLDNFTDVFADIELEQFTKAMNLVEPSLIRIEADEVTYSLHIIIRYEIERDLFADKVSVSELPQVWNEKYEEYLGLEVPDDAKGVMQDTHWASGYYGYFPSYAMGNVYDGMWLENLNKEVPNWVSGLKDGDIIPPIDWMKENIHMMASRYDPNDLVKHVTGKETSAKPFLSYLENKYSALFGF
ncbi:carboxypeptidase M32 [Candidatus Thorarchaeota archaeon]|nr:MAG: carboxypeptidase M32 [Candidatus Thorarchaeota archaeon]